MLLGAGSKQRCFYTYWFPALEQLRTPAQFSTLIDSRGGRKGDTLTPEAQILTGSFLSEPLILLRATDARKTRLSHHGCLQTSALIWNQPHWADRVYESPPRLIWAKETQRPGLKRTQPLVESLNMMLLSKISGSVTEAVNLSSAYMKASIWGRCLVSSSFCPSFSHVPSGSSCQHVSLPLF